MLDISKGLESLLSPVSRDLFLQEHWEKRPLLIQRNTPLYFADLFSLREMDRLISFSEIAYPKIRAIHKNKPDPSLEFMKNALSGQSSFVGQVNTAYKLYSEGCTLFLERLERRSQTIRLLCRFLGKELSHHVSVNAYATPSRSQGFDIHFDDHDVFILQVDGSKHWEIYTPDYPLPLYPSAENRPLSEKERRNLFLTAELTPGDFLYIPRGWHHAAWSADAASLHLTVGIHVFRWTDLIQEALSDVSSNDIRFREALPPGFLEQGAGSYHLQAHLEQLLSVLQTQANADVAETALARRLLLHGESTMEGRLAEINASSEIDLDTELEKPAAMLCRVIENEQACSILFHGKEMTGPVKIAQALRFVSEQRGAFRGRQIQGPLRESEVLVLLRRLIKDGLLRRATSDR